ncbi:DMT family transporter [Paenibacillus sedimenti]|uniref:EamA family transporter n=1 Tax=Paenibacillus sedimenti TaxID=2770274 RepID=A0A926KQ72_9BACL|nr:EamA family transporter [Paenibacillus sedimenti]MBD0380204.1 EamA family transporter [Paenibacillus sedimenti]
MILFNYLLICLIFGTTFLAIKIGVDAAAPPFFSAGLRFFVAGLVLYVWMVGRKKASFSLLLHKEMLLTGIGLTFGTFATLYWAEQYVTSGIAAVLSATGPIMILVLQMVVMRQKPTPRSVWGCIIGFSGVILLLLPSLTLSASGWWVLGCIAILIGEFFYSWGALYSKRVIQRFPEASPIALNAAQMIYGGLLLLLLSAFTEHDPFASLQSPGAIGSLLYLIVIGSMVGHSLFYWLVAKTNPVFPATWLYVSPLIALSIGAMFYGETISWITILGVITIIAGIVMVNLDNLNQLFRRRKSESKKLREVHS